MGQSFSKRRSRRTIQDDLLHSKIKRACRKGQLAPMLQGADEDHMDEMDECPVCLMFFSALNTTTCCSSSICTECYAQVAASQAAHISSKPCPFCNRNAYAVVFRGRKSVLQRDAERSRKLQVEQAMVQARLNEELESQIRRQRRLSADPHSPFVHDEGSLAHEWALAQEAQDALMAQRADQYRAILEQHSGDGRVDSAHDVEELMLMQAMLLSLEDPSHDEAPHESHPGAANGGRPGAANAAGSTTPLESAVQIVHEESEVSRPASAAAEAALEQPLSLSTASSAAHDKFPEDRASLECSSREAFIVPRQSAAAATEGDRASASESGYNGRNVSFDKAGCFVRTTRRPNIRSLAAFRDLQRPLEAHGGSPSSRGGRDRAGSSNGPGACDHIGSPSSDGYIGGSNSNDCSSSRLGVIGLLDSSGSTLEDEGGQVSDGVVKPYDHCDSNNSCGSRLGSTRLRVSDEGTPLDEGGNVRDNVVEPYDHGNSDSSIGSSHTEVRFHTFAAQLACHPSATNGSQPAPLCQTATATTTTGWGNQDAAAIGSQASKNRAASQPHVDDAFSRYIRQGLPRISPYVIDIPGRQGCQPGTGAVQCAIGDLTDLGTAGGRAVAPGWAALVNHPDGTHQLAVLMCGGDDAATKCDAGEGGLPPLLELWEGDPFDREVVAFIRGGDDRLAAATDHDSAIVAATLAADMAFRQAQEQRTAEDTVRQADTVAADNRLAALLVAQDAQKSHDLQSL